jgi:hypothetical protein
MGVNVKKVALFLGLTYALTYLLAIIYFLAGGSVKPPGILIVVVIYMFMPTLCAVVVQKSFTEPVEKAAADQFPVEPMVFGRLVVRFTDGLRNLRSSDPPPRSDFLPGQARQLQVLAA